MRYKLLVCVLVLLIATPIFGQEFSPIVVETGKPTPSVVKSGEPFRITYRVKFLDTVIIKEEDMQPDDLVLEKIEVIALEIDRNLFSRPENDNLGFVNVWDLTYTFRIIQPEKGEYKVPPFNFIWVEKKAGVTEEEAKEEGKPMEFLTEEIGVGYISTVNPENKPVKPPPLDIRDEMVFVSPISEGVTLRRWAYAVIGTAFVSVLILVFRFLRRPKVQQDQEISQEESENKKEEDDVIGGTEPILSLKQARKKFIKELGKLRVENNLDLMKNLRLLIRSLLFAELPGMLRNSMTENEIYTKLCGLNANQKKKIGRKHLTLFYLAQKLVVYQEEIDSGVLSSDLVSEITELKGVVSGLKSHKIFLFFVKHLFGRRR